MRSNKHCLTFNLNLRILSYYDFLCVPSSPLSLLLPPPSPSRLILFFCTSAYQERHQALPRCPGLGLSQRTAETHCVSVSVTVPSQSGPSLINKGRGL